LENRNCVKLAYCTDDEQVAGSGQKLLNRFTNTLILEDMAYFEKTSQAVFASGFYTRALRKKNSACIFPLAKNCKMSYRKNAEKNHCKVYNVNYLRT